MLSYAAGRCFTGARKVRLGDVEPKGRLRLDALIRYCQDVSNDDTTEAGLDDVPPWVVRRTVVDELSPAKLADDLTFTTFCSALGGRWAERRLDIVDQAGNSVYRVATLWVCVDAGSGQPHALTDQFLSLYEEAAAGRKASARLRNPKRGRDLGTDGIDGGDGEIAGVSSHPDVAWQLRKADFDTWGHVNNAAYWAAVEEWLPPFDGPRRFRMEYGGGLELQQLGPERQTTIARRSERDSGCEAVWWLDTEGGAAASATWFNLAAE